MTQNDDDPKAATMATDQALIRPDGPTFLAQRPGGGAMATRQTAMATAFQGLIPTSIGEAMTLAVALSKSKAIPYAYRDKPDTILTVIMAGLEVGLTPIRALNNLTNISGNLGMKADLQLALVRRSGLLDFYDEGYEVRGGTDDDLMNRTQDGAKILALVKAVPTGKPYGWATARRKGDQVLTTRTFTWIDAETAEIWEKDEDGGEKKRTKLSAKFNYVAFPADMYPKRARGRVLQITHSDVLAGMLSTEAMEGGQVIEADYVVEPQGDDADTILRDIGDQDQELATGIDTGFNALKMSPARRLQKLVEYKGRPKDLLTWLRDEYGQRAGKGKVGTERAAKEAAQALDPPAPAADAQPAAPAAPPANAAPAQAQTSPAPADATPAASQAPPANAGRRASDVAKSFRDRFKPGTAF